MPSATIKLFLPHGDPKRLRTAEISNQYVPFVVATREAFTKDGTLVAEGDRLVFTRDVEFSSPSAAAAIVHGGSANGLIAWKDKAGRTLKEIEGE